jgi:hypothetical protein
MDGFEPRNPETSTFPSAGAINISTAIAGPVVVDLKNFTIT